MALPLCKTVWKPLREISETTTTLAAISLLRITPSKHTTGLKEALEHPLHSSSVDNTYHEAGTRASFRGWTDEHDVG